jgi:polysaccharide pyruvyl transferase WcaK-like protein
VNLIGDFSLAASFTVEKGAREAGMNIQMDSQLELVRSGREVQARARGGFKHLSGNCVIGLLDHLGHGNLGDEATFTTFMSNIKTRVPGAKFVGLSLNPVDTFSRHGIPSFAIRRDSKLPPETAVSAEPAPTVKDKIKKVLAKVPFLLSSLQALNTILVRHPKALVAEVLFLIESLRVLRPLDLLIISGGGQLLDSWGGPWSFPYTLFKWVVLARLCGIRCCFVSVGAGPLQKKLSRSLIKFALQLSDYNSFRDDRSQAMVREDGFKGDTRVRPDCVYSLNVNSFLVESFRRGLNGAVGISPMIYCDPRVYWEKDQFTYNSLINKLGQFGTGLLERGYCLSLFSSDTRIDLPAIADLRKALCRDSVTQRVDQSQISEPRVHTTDDLLSAISKVDYIVTCRFHGVIFAQLLNKPVIALSHHQKVATLMSDLGLSEFCLDIKTSDSRLMAMTFQRLEENQEAIKARMASKVDQYSLELAEQFDELFSCRPETEAEGKPMYKESNRRDY